MTSVHSDVGEVLIDEEVLRARVVELGAEISEDYDGRDLLLVGVLKGAIFFISDLMRELTVPCEVDFMAISSYGAASSRIRSEMKKIAPFSTPTRSRSRPS